MYLKEIELETQNLQQLILSISWPILLLEKIFL